MRAIFVCKTCEVSEHYEPISSSELDVGLVQLLMLIETFKTDHPGHDCKFMTDRASVWERV